LHGGNNRMTTLPKVFDIPDSESELVSWLEEQLCSRDFFETVESLSLVQSLDQAPDENDKPNSISEETMNAVLVDGLDGLSTADLQSLLENPRELYRLQDAIFQRGGSYWTKRFEGAAFASPAALQNVQKAISQHGNESLVGVTDAHGSSHSTQLANPSWLQRHPALSALAALAAALLLFVGGFWAGNQQGTTNVAVAPVDPNVVANPPDTIVSRDVWGWSRPDLLEVTLDRKDKLNHLANLLSEWNTQESVDAPQLLQRARELRASCDDLLAAKLSGLPEADVDWLKDKCKIWSAKIDEKIARLSDPQQFESVSQELNRLVHKSIFAIRQRAKVG